MSCKLSIIIPVYNTAVFLQQCLDSILNQELEDIEIICVNDGSTDRSLEILENNAQKDSRIIIINQENQGVSVARNNGLKNAKGEYVGFVDADDFISKNYFSQFLNESDYDLIAIKPQGFAKLLSSYLDTEKIKCALAEEMLKQDDFNAVWSKVFKNKIIQKYHISFPVGMRLGEDAHFIFNFLQYASSLRFLENASGYFYRENVDGATKREVNDYSVFDRVFSEFHFDHKLKYEINLSDDQILSAKLHKLFATYLSALSLYFRANTKLSKHARWQMVKKSMQQFLLIYQIYPNHPFWKINRGRFENLILAALVNNQFWKLKLAFAYSHWRNGIK